MARHLGDQWVLPAIDDLNRAWFTSGQISVQVCEDCDAFLHPPDEICSECQGSHLSFRACSGSGRIESVVVVHHAIGGLANSVPYAIALVSLDDAPGVNAIGNVVNREPAEVKIGQRVNAVFEEAPDADGGPPLLIPQWEVV